MMQKRCSLKFHTPVNKWEKDDKKHLKNFLEKLSVKQLCEELSLENHILWKEKLLQEDLILKNPYDLEANKRAYLYEISICYRAEILKSIKKNLPPCFPDKNQVKPYIKEMIKPITKETVSRMGKRPVKYGREEMASRAKPVGEMKCILVKEHDEMLYHLLNAKKMNLLGERKILLHFDAHSDMGTIQEDDLKEILNIDDLKELRYRFSSMYYQLKNPGNLRTPLTLATFLHYGVRKNLVREIFWLLPDPAFSKLRIPANLEKNYILNIENGKNFRFEKGYVTCDWHGIKVHISRIQDLTEFQEDVIVDIDMDYFVNMDDSSSTFGCRGYRVLDEEDFKYWYEMADVNLEKGDVKPWIRLEEFCNILRSKNIRSPLAFLSLSPYFTHNYYHKTIIEKLAGLLGEALNRP